MIIEGQHIKKQKHFYQDLYVHVVYIEIDTVFTRWLETQRLMYRAQRVFGISLG